MTVLEMDIKKNMEKYGFKRYCKCYKMNCIVLPETVFDLAVESTARLVEFAQLWTVGLKKVTKKGGEKT